MWEAKTNVFVPDAEIRSSLSPLGWTELVGGRIPGVQADQVRTEAVQRAISRLVVELNTVTGKINRDDFSVVQTGDSADQGSGEVLADDWPCSSV